MNSTCKKGDEINSRRFSITSISVKNAVVLAAKENYKRLRSGKFQVPHQ